eukprot:jgi/Bigna1/82788/fgenesh1_pg.97_\
MKDDESSALSHFLTTIFILFRNKERNKEEWQHSTPQETPDTSSSKPTKSINRIESKIVNSSTGRPPGKRAQDSVRSHHAKSLNDIKKPPQLPSSRPPKKPSRKHRDSPATTTPTPPSSSPSTSSSSSPPPLPSISKTRSLDTSIDPCTEDEAPPPLPPKSPRVPTPPKAAKYATKPAVQQLAPAPAHPKEVATSSSGRKAVQLSSTNPFAASVVAQKSIAQPPPRSPPPKNTLKPEAEGGDETAATSANKDAPSFAKGPITVLLKPLTANESHDESNIEGKQGDDVQDESEGAKRAGAQSLDIKASLVSEHEEVDPSAVVEGELKASRATIISIDGEGLEGGGGPVSPTVSLADAESWEEDFELLRFEVVAHMQLEKAYFADQDRQLKAIRERIDAAISSFAHFRDFALRRLEMLDREIRDYDITYESSTTAWPAKFGVCEVASVQVACMSYLAANQRLANQGNGMRKVLEKDILPVVKREIERLQYAKKCETIEPEENHNKFSLDAKVSILKEAYDPTDSKSVKKVEHLLPPERDKDTAERLDSLEIMKIGTMYYRFVTVGIKTWRPVFILLSGSVAAAYKYMMRGACHDAAFLGLFHAPSGNAEKRIKRRGILHVFQSEDEEKPMMTIGLHYCTINLAPSVHPNAFRIMEAKPSITGGEKQRNPIIGLLLINADFGRVSDREALLTDRAARTMAEWMVIDV